MSYELVAVARTPSVSGPPTLVEIDPIVAPTITWTRTLNGPGSIAFSCTPDRLSEQIRTRLLDLEAHPTEVKLYRDGDVVAAGLIGTYQVQGGTLSVTAPGLLGYLSYMLIDADLPFSGVDQHLIAKGLVDQWQTLPYGNYGINTSGISTSGVTRDRTYLAAEQSQVLRRLTELGQAADGFDIDVDPQTRALLLFHPQQGSDLSDAVVLDSRDITDPGVSVSVSPGVIATEAFGLGGSAGVSPITSRKANPTLRSTWGRAGVSSTFDGVTNPATLDEHTQALLDARSSALFLPGPGLRPVADAAIGSFDVGDTVTYDYDAGLGRQTGQYRVAELVTTVNDQSVESMAVRFA